MNETSSTSTIQIPIITGRKYLATKCLTCEETIAIDEGGKIPCICEKCKAAIHWARRRMDAEHGRTEDD